MITVPLIPCHFYCSDKGHWWPSNMQIMWPLCSAPWLHISVFDTVIHVFLLGNFPSLNFWDTDLSLFCSVHLNSFSELLLLAALFLISPWGLFSPDLVPGSFSIAHALFWSVPLIFMASMTTNTLLPTSSPARVPIPHRVFQIPQSIKITSWTFPPVKYFCIYSFPTLLTAVILNFNLSCPN